MDLDLPLRDLDQQAREHSGGRPMPLKEWIALAEAWRITQALRETRGNRSAAARALGIGRRTLYSKMEKLGLTPVWLVPDAGRSSAAANTSQSEPTLKIRPHSRPERPRS
jgi:hypothetical protein